MKALTLVVLSLIGCSIAYLIKVPTTNTATQPIIAPLGWVHIQKLLLPLFDNVCEESTNMAVVQLAQDFTLDGSNGDYMKTEVLENMRNLKTGKGLLPKGQIFTESNIDHMNELKALFEVFYYAKNFDTFYKAAAWARQNVNCGLFVDAIYLAIVNRKDTAKVSVPAPYELLPNYFINKDVVVRASFLLTADDVSPTPEADVRVEGNSYVLDANYTTDIDEGDEESKLAYFREDIGLNSYYFIRKLRNVPWFNTPNVEDNLYGERMFMMMQQFAARYDLERYSHGLPELEGFDWEATAAYDPMLIYSNGNEFDHRTFTNVLTDNDDVAFLKTIENNLSTVVNHLRQAGHNKAQILSHLMEILVTSDRSYETLCRKFLGYDKDLSERNNSVLEHYMTTLRDPVFWRINKKMVQIINNALKVLPSYYRNELYFPGVEILNVETKKMMTNFDNFQFDVTDSLKTSTANTTFQVKIAQPRLNHKPFVLKLNISSLVLKKGLVKIYLGPKMMPGELALKKHLFVPLDLFEVTLKRGFNVISRSSEDMTSFSGDFISLRALRKKVEDTEFGLDALPLKSVESQIGYPARLILPRGLPEGLPLQVFVFIAPLTKGTLTGTTITNMELNTAVLSPGYPLDLPVEIKQLFGLPNSMVREFMVTHKSETAKPENGGRPGGRPGPNNYNNYQTFDTHQTDYTMNGDVNTEYSQDYDLYDDSLSVRGLLGDRPDFTYRKTETANYAGNKNKYRKNEDYASNSRDKSHYTFDRDVNNDKFVDNLSVHGLLGSKPEFYRKKDTTGYTEKKTEIRTKDFMSKTKNKYADSETVNPDKNTHYSIPVKNVVEDDFSYVDTLLPHGLLGDNLNDFKNKKDDSEYTAKKYQYIKKEEDRTVKREQKKEKILSKAEQKKEEGIGKGEKKREEVFAKRDKHLKDIENKKDKEQFKEELKDKNKSETTDRFYDMTTGNMASEYDSYEDMNDHFEHKDKIVQHNLLGAKADTVNTKNSSGYKAKTYQFKKKKEEFDPIRAEYKKVNYREELLLKENKNANILDKNKNVFIAETDKYNKKYIDTDDNRDENDKYDKKYKTSDDVKVVQITDVNLKNKNKVEKEENLLSGDITYNTPTENKEVYVTKSDKYNKKYIKTVDSQEADFNLDSNNKISKEEILLKDDKNFDIPMKNWKESIGNLKTDKSKIIQVNDVVLDGKNKIDKDQRFEENIFFNIPVKNREVIVSKGDKYDKKYIKTDDNKIIEVTDFNLNDNNEEKKQNADTFVVKDADYVIFPNNLDESKSFTKKPLQKIINNNLLGQNDLLNKTVYKDITKNVNSTNKEKDDKTVTKDITKVIENKQVNKNIDKSSKNVLLDRNTVTKKDITKNIPVRERDDSVSSDESFTSTEESDEKVNFFSIYEPVVTTELSTPNRRVTVYDFLFNPTQYEEVYE